MTGLFHRTGIGAVERRAVSGRAELPCRTRNRRSCSPSLQPGPLMTGHGTLVRG